MKNKFLTGLISLFLLLNNASELHAEELRNKFFLGVDGLFNMYTIYGVPGASIAGGYRWNNFGLELGYSKLGDECWGQNVVLQSQNAYLDLLGFYPISDCFEVKGLIGVGIFNTKTKNSSQSSFSQSIWRNKSSETAAGFRAGLGVQYWINDAITAELMYKFQTNRNVFIGFMSIYSLGFRYYF